MRFVSFLNSSLFVAVSHVLYPLALVHFRYWVQNLASLHYCRTIPGLLWLVSSSFLFALGATLFFVLRFGFSYFLLYCRFVFDLNSLFFFYSFSFVSSVISSSGSYSSSTCASFSCSFIFCHRFRLFRLVSWAVCSRAVSALVCRFCIGCSVVASFS